MTQRHDGSYGVVGNAQRDDGQTRTACGAGMDRFPRREDVAAAGRVCNGATGVLDALDLGRVPERG